MPLRHRRRLHDEQVDFQRWIKSQYSHSSWKSKLIRNAVVQPFQDLLNKPSGGDAYCGGVIFGDVSVQSTLRHYRSRRAIDRPLYSLKSGQSPLAIVDTRQFWCGPLAFHFGHQIADFGSRILLASIDPREGELLWCPWRSGNKWDQLENWQKFLLNYLNPGQKVHHFCTQPLQIRELVIIPQQARMHAAPSPEHLEALSWCQKSISPKFSTITYVSRSLYAPCNSKDTLLGSFAGERLFEKLLLDRGVKVIYPESITLKEQLEVYKGSSILIFSEGSAQHGLELLGFDSYKQVIVLCRRKQKKGMDQPLNSRFPRTKFVQAILAQWKATDGVPWDGLAMLSWPDIAKTLNPVLDKPLTDGDVLALEQASEHQLKNLLMSLPLQKFG